jgi:hypothetical protein
MDDYAREMALSDLHYEAVMARAAREQAIFLLVEGDSEEVAIPLLMTDVVDLDELGIKVANYNGHGNLRAALRLLYVVLGHQRPVIVTHDNDPASVQSVRKCADEGLLTDLTYVLPIPSDPVVHFADESRGGSFEEAFPPDVFLTAAFERELLPIEIAAARDEFEQCFDLERPWLRQLRRFCANRGFFGWDIAKRQLAEQLALESDDLPPTFARLAELVTRARDEHPVVHPDDVELPKVRGLTDFGDWPSAIR